MPRRLANLSLLAAIATLLVTGVVAWLLPEPVAAPLFVAHRVAGLALVLGAFWKYAIARRSLRRRGLGPSTWFGLLGAAAMASLVIDQLALAKRPTGSRHAGSFTGDAFPTTIWAFDRVPSIDTAQWRLRISGAVARPTALSYSEIDALHRQDLAAVLDCTGGWWSEQVWSGVRGAQLLEAQNVDGVRSVEVVSVTGHRWTLDRTEIEHALLATRLQGEPLSAAHGYPLRLVVPGRRGFTWVKWVGEIVVA